MLTGGKEQILTRPQTAYWVPPTKRAKRWHLAFYLPWFYHPLPLRRLLDEPHVIGNHLRQTVKRLMKDAPVDEDYLPDHWEISRFITYRSVNWGAALKLPGEKRSLISDKGRRALIQALEWAFDCPTEFRTKLTKGTRNYSTLRLTPPPDFRPMNSLSTW